MEILPAAWAGTHACKGGSLVSATAKMELLPEGVSMLEHGFPVARQKIRLGSGKHGTDSESVGNLCVTWLKTIPGVRHEECLFLSRLPLGKCFIKGLMVGLYFGILLDCGCLGQMGSVPPHGDIFCLMVREAV